MKSIFQALSSLVVIGLLFGYVPLSFAQAGQGWSRPVNVSLSGTATTPFLVIDSGNVLHAIWVDELDQAHGYRYSRSTDGITWTKPKTADYPFDPKGAPPVFLASEDGGIHVFWIGNGQQLFHARVTALTISEPAAWSSTTSRLAQYVANYDAILDSEGDIHVAYIHNRSAASAAAGIYYRQSNRSGIAWSSETKLYESEYYRSATNSDSSVRIATSNVSAGQRVYVVWDSRPEQRVFMAISENSGRSWSEAQQIQSAEDLGGIDAPFSINVAAAGDKVLIIWQAGEPGGARCAVFSQWSQDAGKSWAGVVSVLAGRTACPVDSKFIIRNDDYFVVLMAGQVDPTLVAWNGEQWSSPQAQIQLPVLSNPLTYNAILLGCRYDVVREDRIYVVGCEQGGGGGDVWFISRALDPVDTWFSLPSTWGVPAKVPVPSETISGLASVSDRKGQIHAVWAQSSRTNDGSRPVSLEYARWDGTQWTVSDRVMASLGSIPFEVSLGIDSQERLLLTWVDGEGGGLRFSWAKADRAHMASEWAKPANVPSPTDLIDSQDLLVDGSGRIVVVYAIPLNERRGVYVVQSTDSGQSWSVPVRIFDAVSAHWEKVGKPRISLGKGGLLHVIFTRASVQPGQPVGLYYAGSVDGGTTWSDPQALSENDIRWSDIVCYQDRTVHVSWQEYDGLVFANLSRISGDAGLTWGKDRGITGVNDGPTVVGLAANGSGELHFVQLVKDRNATTITQQSLILQDWKWDGSGWGLASSSDLMIQGNGADYSLAADVTSKGFIGVLMSVVHPDTGNAVENEILAFDRFLKGSTPPGQMAVPLIPTPMVQSTVTATPSGLPTQFTDLSALNDNGVRTSSTLRNFIGIILVGAVVVITVLVSTRGRKKTKQK